MYLGVVGCPQPDRNFDGRIALERVSRRKKLTQASRNKTFLVDVLVAKAIAKSKWKDQLVTPGMTVDHLLDSIRTQYDLDEYVSDQLVIGYETYTTSGNKKWKELELTDNIHELGFLTTKEGNQVLVTLDDLQLLSNNNNVMWSMRMQLMIQSLC